MSATSIAPAGASAAGAAPADATSSWADKLKSSLTNPSTLLTAAGLGYNILAGNKQTPNLQAVTNAANAQAGQGAQLQSYLNNGTLPPGLQARLTDLAQQRLVLVSAPAGYGKSALMGHQLQHWPAGQALAWSAGVLLFAVLVGVCALVVWRNARGRGDAAADGVSAAEGAGAVRRDGRVGHAPLTRSRRPAYAPARSR